MPPADVGAELVRTDRGGDVTYHGPGQLVGYPILTCPASGGGGMADTVAYVRSVEQLVIDALADLGLPGAGRLDGYPGVWVDPEATTPARSPPSACGSTRGRTMHGFALNVDPDLAYFDHIVPCGIADKAVTSLAAEGVDASMRKVVDAVVARAVDAVGRGGHERADVVWRHTPSTWRRSAAARARQPGRSGCGPRRRRRCASRGRLRRGRRHRRSVDRDRKPEWLRAGCTSAPTYLRLKHTMRDLDLVTVCEEAGCPNIFECWADGTATFMINGERCTRACGFCLVDTRHPEPLDPDEPARVAEAVDAHGPALRGGHRGRPRRSGRRRRRGVRRDDPGHPPPHPGTSGRGAHPRLQGRPGRAGDASSPPGPTC